jgi:hypothetical protein
MNHLFTYLLELNVSMLLFFTAYKLLFEKDKNFSIRRIYLMGIMILAMIIPLLPVFRPISTGQGTPITINLEEITVFGSGPSSQRSFSLSLMQWLGVLYLVVLALGIMRLLLQLFLIFRAAHQSGQGEQYGISYHLNKDLHASSFFGYIFIDTDASGEDSFRHILAHEYIHQKEWHSIDRIMVELFVMINWFNPLAWMVRRSLIENLEYLADSAVLRTGTDPVKYQLSILNQYIGSASISNQFSSQIKNRINMLNRNYKLGSGWKLAILFPLAITALIIASCTESDDSAATVSDQTEEVAVVEPAPVLEGALFTVVEEMPTFNGGDPAMEFRKYIAYNIRYPEEAKENGITGKVFIHFVVTSEGKVVVPDEQTMANLEGKSLDEVVVVTYRTMEKGAEVPDEKYIQMLKDEVIRVVSSSPDWQPGKQHGKTVNVSFTFPVNFAMQ